MIVREAQLGGCTRRRTVYQPRNSSNTVKSWYRTAGPLLVTEKSSSETYFAGVVFRRRNKAVHIHGKLEAGDLLLMRFDLLD